MIRSIHPLYLVGFMLILLFALIWQNNTIKKEIAYEQTERAHAREMAKRIVELKKVMKEPNKRQLDSFFKSTLFSGAELSYRVKDGRYIITARMMDARQLQVFLNRILNMSVKIMQLKVETKDDKHTSIHMEISL